MWWKETTFLATLSVGALLLCSAPALADVVRLSTGRMITGQIIAETSHSVTIETPEGKFTFPRQRISTIERESPAHNQLREIGDLLQEGQLDVAAASYREHGLDNAFAKDTFESLLLDRLKDSAGSITVTSPTAAALANRLKLAIDPPPELLLFTAVLAAENRQINSAQLLASRVPSPMQRQPVWTQKSLSELTERLAEASIKNNDGQLVALSVRLSAQFTPDSTSKSPSLMAVYAQIDAHRAKKDYIRAAALFRPELFLHRSDIFVPLAEKVLHDLLKSPARQQNIAALESARVTLFPYIGETMRKKTVRHLIAELVEAGQLLRAQQTAVEISQQDPDIGAYATHLVNFHTRRLELPGNVPLQHYKLASWARSMGLLEESKALLAPLQQDPRFMSNVNLQLQLIETARCQQAVADLQKLYKDGDFTSLVTQCEQFISTSPPEEFAAKARDFVQLANFHKWNAKNKSSSLAEAEYQQAERLAQRAEYDAALNHLNKIQTEPGNTAAAAKAAALRDKILKAKQQNATR